jgi:serine/threonine-protein kinase
LSSHDTLEDVRFIPGTMLARRYRIVGLLGRGGMGEVYRADDLTLGQPVALKFLPESLERDEIRLERLLNEVRTARQIAHPNVCRVHDVVEEDGHHFLSMEYVDGEDLSTLLRRIGRLPKDKALQISRQLCAGLAAAHGQGVLHRDLKPANVMIDGRGGVRIMDFGLAGLVEEIGLEEARSGTPAYMAPEQLGGEGVTVRSDLYALGLVLYELFTGKKAFDARSAADVARLQRDSTPTTPSSLVDGFDPAIERVILRCLDRTPAQRPASALAVAAALPGGDPLAAALAAGETPSPEMVAAAGEVGGLQPMLGAGVLVLVILGLVGSLFVGEESFVLGHVNLAKPPEALTVAAREQIETFGYTEAPVDSAYGFTYDNDRIGGMEAGVEPAEWSRLGETEPSLISFWYRQGPRHLVPVSYRGPVGADDPPAQISGMIDVRLSPDGRLERFLAVPPQVDETQFTGAPTDWSALFDAAGLSMPEWTRVDPTRNPLLNCDESAAWEGVYPGQPDLPLRIEACSYRGKPAFFELIPPWRQPRRMVEVGLTRGAAAFLAIAITLLTVISVGSALLARRNIRLGRGDRRGAFLLASWVFILALLQWALTVDHVPALAELGLFVAELGPILLAAGLVWLIYMALEPYVRRLWPDVLISWSRLLAGQWRDPLIGRDILIGSLAGTGLCLLGYLGHQLPLWLGRTVPPPQQGLLFGLRGIRQAASMWATGFLSMLVGPMIILLVILLLRVLVRNSRVAVGLAFVIFVGFTVIQLPQFPLSWLVSAVGTALMLFVLLRLGLLATIVAVLFNEMALFSPITADPASWYAGRVFAGVALMVALAAYGFYLSLAGRSLLPADDVFGE